MSTTRQAQQLVGLSDGVPGFEPGERVSLRLESGEVVEATISREGKDSTLPARITAKAKVWKRWAGTPDDLIGFLEKATAEIEARSAERPKVNIEVDLDGHDEERYVDGAVFEREVCSTDPGTPGGRLREIQTVTLTIGPTRQGSLLATAIFSRSGTALALEGSDRAIVSGLKEELSPIIEAGRPRVPALPAAGEMFVGGIAGIAYVLGLSRIDWSFMPSGILGSALFGVIYLVGFIALIYAMTTGMKSLLPALTLVRSGQRTPSQQLARRVGGVVGPLALAAVPFALEQIFAK